MLKDRQYLMGIGTRIGIALRHCHRIEFHTGTLDFIVLAVSECFPLFFGVPYGDLFNFLIFWRMAQVWKQL